MQLIFAQGVFLLYKWTLEIICTESHYVDNNCSVFTAKIWWNMFWRHWKALGRLWFPKLSWEQTQGEMRNLAIFRTFLKCGYYENNLSSTAPVQQVERFVQLNDSRRRAVHWLDHHREYTMASSLQTWSGDLDILKKSKHYPLRGTPN